MKETINLKLKLPDQSDYVNIQDLNDNANLIDREIKEVSSQILGHITDSKVHITQLEKTKLAEVESGANRYVHPETHDATMIVEDNMHRFVSDTDIDNWNKKADKIDIGNKTMLKTTNKTSIVEAINELFTSANNGKLLLETAIVGKKGNVSKKEPVPTFNELKSGVESIKLGYELNVPTKDKIIIEEGVIPSSNLNHSSFGIKTLAYTGENPLDNPYSLLGVKPGECYYKLYESDRRYHIRDINTGIKIGEGYVGTGDWYENKYTMDSNGKIHNFRYKRVEGRTNFYMNDIEYSYTSYSSKSDLNFFYVTDDGRYACFSYLVYDSYNRKSWSNVCYIDLISKTKLWEKRIEDSSMSCNVTSVYAKNGQVYLTKKIGKRDDWGVVLEGDNYLTVLRASTSNEVFTYIIGNDYYKRNYRIMYVDDNYIFFERDGTFYKHKLGTYSISHLATYSDVPRRIDKHGYFYYQTDKHTITKKNADMNTIATYKMNKYEQLKDFQVISNFYPDHNGGLIIEEKVTNHSTLESNWKISDVVHLYPEIRLVHIIPGDPTYTIKKI
ncbi:hypothetical protein CLPU_1c02140 [Gottschalkia purinilytica]|uniref:Uncharacterized protein n=1 Tax=Gottschalkia purinilytica TaxID=1503 RepID=A0A0L0WF00_GOTPU|nr:hypothetical protein [Gottschalkia purinilytica]KNF10049.1 hypothetical protein CLPU_1c02140 [Gottschalkia purinilytica]